MHTPTQRKHFAKPIYFYSIFEPLKRSIAIVCLLVFLGANTELHQVLRLPALIHHFLEHHEEDPDTSFADFIYQHYSEHHNHSVNPRHNHNNLPFKAKDSAMAHFSLAFVNQIQFTIPRPAAFGDKISPIYRGAFYPSPVVTKIWEPPKIS